MSLLRGEVGLVLGPDVSRAFELGSGLDLGAANLVDRFADELHEVEAVEGDLGLCEVLGDAGDLVGTPCLEPEERGHWRVATTGPRA